MSITEQVSRRVSTIESYTEALVERLRRWADLLQILASFGIVWSAIVYITGGDDRRNAANIAAWQVMNAAQGKAGNGGRAEALRVLIDGGEVLANINLDSAWIGFADLSEGYLRGAKMRGVQLYGGNLRNAFLNEADLSEAKLWNVDLRDASLGFVRLKSADLFQANLEGADFASADLTNAELRDIRNWHKIKCFTGANIAGIRRAPAGFREWAIDTAGAIEGVGQTPKTSGLKTCS